MKKILIKLSAALFSAVMLTSCFGNSEVLYDDVWITYDFTIEPELYNPEGYWIDAYNPEMAQWSLYPTAFFSHKAEVTSYDGVEYKSYTGFVPSVVYDIEDHSGEDWTQYQFASVAGLYEKQGYVVAHWDTRENETTQLVDRSCLIDLTVPVKPVSIAVTNTTYAYYVMQNGSAFSKPFTSDSYLDLDIYGVSKGKETYFQTVHLYSNGLPVANWQLIDLTGMGEVEQIYFTMRSSDTGEWGMNTPAYFALSSFQVVYPGNKN